MKNRWLTLVSVVLVIYTYFVVATQFYQENPDKLGVLSITLTCMKHRLAMQRTNIVEFDKFMDPFPGLGRQLALGLPKDARIFMNDMLGPTNREKCLPYGYLTYHLFPREVAVSMDQPARFTKDGFLGRPPSSEEDLRTNGFDVVVETVAKTNHSQVWFLHDVPFKPPTNPEWFRSRRDVVIAFLLPLFTALTGLWLVRFVFPTLYPRLTQLEKLACGFGMGMMVVAALTLGIKLCGYHGRSLVLVVTGAGAVLAIWRNGKDFWAATKSSFGEAIQSPAVIVGGLYFLLVFWAAGVWGLAESDAIAAWMLKAKIIHLHTGGEIVRWFSEPRLAHAHLDYPTLVPSLHAATFDALGHVDEYVTKFWPVWMLLVLLGALASLTRGEKGLIRAPSFFLLALLLLPATRLYAELEGSTMPMVFFTTMGFVQCALWQVEKDRARLGLGVILLFGAAMTKFEGFITLGVAGVWIMLLPSARPLLKGWLQPWRLLAFCCVAVLPFLCLRVQIPVLHHESGWLGYALHNPWGTLSHLPLILVLIISRSFVSDVLASWGDHLIWNGRWEGFSSVYDHPTQGLAWMSLLMTVALWFAVPARRKIIVWMLAVIATTLVAFSTVFASFVGIISLDQVLRFTNKTTSGRYLFPILVAWSATIVILLYREAFPVETQPVETSPAKSEHGRRRRN